MEGVTVVDHVLLRRLVSILRDRHTPHGVFRQTLDDAAMILAYEAMRALRPDEIDVETPLEGARGVRLADEVVIVAILRAGLGLVDGFLRLVPDARVGHLGMYRDEEALRPVGYYENIPAGVEDAEVFVVDPMLATGGSSVQAIARLKRRRAADLVRVPGRRARGCDRAPSGAHGGPDPHRRARPRARRQRLHPAGAG
jgi:uracil phosphoribosyltransferase